jgi:DNA-binding NarL/FixJ family response regulator
VRVVIAEDQVLLREGLGRLFEDGGHQVVASLGDAQGLVAAISEHEPDLVVLDIRMPPTFTDEGARAAKEIKETHPGLGVLVLSQHIETSHAVALVTLGGFGYLLKDRVLAIDDFLQAVNRVASGGTAIDPDVISQLLGRRRAHDPLDKLTAREREILALMAEGRSNHGICQKLYLSPKTVESHVHNIFSKLGVAAAPDDHRRVLAVLTYLRS